MLASVKERSTNNSEVHKNSKVAVDFTAHALMAKVDRCSVDGGCSHFYIIHSLQFFCVILRLYRISAFLHCKPDQHDQPFLILAVDSLKTESFRMIDNRDRIVRLKAVLDRTGLSRSEVCRKIGDVLLQIMKRRSDWGKAENYPD
ncbi:MAG: hypothetical protein ABJP02_18625 [Parasphingorhabdus sp.]|uniref:hypothetical protein n=1 Tax=Parasphingorhabdus sp. TaxID=2709688 RepID=UPI003299F662